MEGGRDAKGGTVRGEEVQSQPIGCDGGQFIDCSNYLCSYLVRLVQQYLSCSLQHYWQYKCTSDHLLQ